MNSYLQFGAALVASLPIIAIAAIGICIAVVRRTVHPRPSLLVSFGLLAFICNGVGSAAFQVYAQNQIAYTHNLIVFNFGLYALQLAGLVLVTAAVFSGRKVAVKNA